MVKAAVAPTVAFAIYTRHSDADDYLNFGFVMIIVSITTVLMALRNTNEPAFRALVGIEVASICAADYLKMPLSLVRLLVGR